MHQYVKTTLTETTEIKPWQFKKSLHGRRIIRNSNRKKLGRMLSNIRKSKSTGDVISGQPELKEWHVFQLKCRIHMKEKKNNS